MCVPRSQIKLSANFHCLLQDGVNAASRPGLFRPDSRPVAGQHAVLDALHVVDEELALEAVVDRNAQIDKIKDDKPQHTDSLQCVAPLTGGEGEGGGGRGGGREGRGGGGRREGGRGRGGGRGREREGRREGRGGGGRGKREERKGGRGVGERIT